jgi:hypothetical protein
MTHKISTAQHMAPAIPAAIDMIMVNIRVCRFIIRPFKKHSSKLSINLTVGQKFVHVITKAINGKWNSKNFSRS